jgi:hypothetical protein
VRSTTKQIKDEREYIVVDQAQLLGDKTQRLDERFHYFLFLLYLVWTDFVTLCACVCMVQTDKEKKEN